MALPTLTLSSTSPAGAGEVGALAAFFEAPAVQNAVDRQQGI